MSMEAENYVLKVARRIAQEVNGDLGLFRLVILQELREDPAFLEAARSISEETLEKLLRAARVFCDVCAGRELAF